MAEAFERAGFVVKKGDRVLDAPLLLNYHRDGDMVRLVVRLPIGRTVRDLHQHQHVFESATGAEMEAWAEGQVAHIALYTRRLPQRVRFREGLTNGFAAALGYSRRGLEVIDFRRVNNPHIMLAGRSGAGKSNALHVILVQLVGRPDTRLYLVDPKCVEFVVYRGVSGVEAVETEPRAAVRVVREVLGIVRQRQELLTTAGYRLVFDFNETAADPLPAVFLVIDETADFTGRDFERFWEDVAEIARKGRAFGVFLVLAAQRTDRETIPMAVKNNLGIRIAMRVESVYDSRTILGDDSAAFLPDIPGRAIVRTDRTREVQIFRLDDDQQAAILLRLRGAEA